MYLFPLCIASFYKFNFVPLLLHLLTRRSLADRMCCYRLGSIFPVLKTEAILVKTDFSHRRAPFNFWYCQQKVFFKFKFF